MIYTVTLNPTLDITYFLERLSFGEVARALEVERTPGGKGINVSRALHAMGVDSIAMGLVGGYSGNEVLSRLQDEGIILQIVRIDDETRTNIVILGRDDGRELVIRSAGPPVEPAAVERIRYLLFGEAQRPEAVVLSGSLPPGVGDDTYATLIAEGTSIGSLMILDAEGECLRKGIEAHPHLIKPNRIELEGLAGRRLGGDREILEFASELNSSGIRVVAVSLGGDGALLVTREEAWRGYVPEVEADTVGAGDSMVAGLVLGMTRGETPEQTLRMGLAYSLSAVMNSGPGLTQPAIHERAYELVRVERMAGLGRS